MRGKSASKADFIVAAVINVTIILVLGLFITGHWRFSF